MPIALVPLGLPQLESLDIDPLRLDGRRVATGALPPRVLLERAAGGLRDGLPRVWCSPFLFVEERVGAVVGSGGFKGLPIDGRVEIGYGVAAAYRGRGFATAGVHGLLRVAFGEAGVVEAYAETALDNPASRRVVEKLGFRHLGRRPTEADGIVDRWLKSV